MKYIEVIDTHVEEYPNRLSNVIYRGNNRVYIFDLQYIICFDLTLLDQCFDLSEFSVKTSVKTQHEFYVRIGYTLCALLNLF